MHARTGAIWTTTVFFSSAMASHTFSVSSRSRRAPTGTVGDALAAEGTVCIGDPAVALDIDSGSGTGTGHIPDTQSLHFIADLDAAHALDALFRVADERETLVPRSTLYTLFKWQINDVQVVRNVCRVQLPLRTQVAHLKSCWDRISCTFCFLAMRTFGLLVRISRPSCTLLLQAVTSALCR